MNLDGPSSYTWICFLFLNTRTISVIENVHNTEFIRDICANKIIYTNYHQSLPRFLVVKKKKNRAHHWAWPNPYLTGFRFRYLFSNFIKTVAHQEFCVIPSRTPVDITRQLDLNIDSDWFIVIQQCAYHLKSRHETLFNSLVARRSIKHL